MVAKSDIFEQFQRSFREYDNNKSAYIILVDGKRVKVRNGKSIWSTVGAAKNALRNHLDMYSRRAFDLGLSSTAIEDEWIEQHVKVVSISEYEAAKAKLKAK